MLNILPLNAEQTPEQTSAADANFPARSAAPTLNDLTARLRRCGLRLTPGRRAMLAGLMRCPTPVTLSQLQEVILPQRVAVATLFRSMLRLEEVELVTRTLDLNGTANWALNLGRPRGFQLTRRDSGQVDPIDAETARPLAYLLAQIEQRLRQRGYSRLQLSVAFRGVNPHSAQAPIVSAAPAPQQHVA